MYPAIQNNQGLKGFWGGLFKGLAKIVADMTGEIPLVGGYVKQQLTIFIETNVNWNWKKADILLTDSEELILTQFTENILGPFIKLLATDLSNSLQNQNFAVQLNGINLALRRVCLLKSYFPTSQTKGLSADALAARMELITEVLIPIETLIGETLATRTDLNFLSKSTPFNAAEFTGIITSGNSYACNQYELQKGQSPADQQPISQTAIQDAANTGATTTTTPKSDSPIERNILLALAALLVLVGLTSKSKKNE